MTTFLIVDDSMMTRMMVKTIVTEHFPDWDIMTAKDAEDALQQVATTDFDIATVDMNMPGMTGLELIPYLKGKNSSAKIALLTANIQESIRTKADDLGIQVINKPVREELILEFINSDD